MIRIAVNGCGRVGKALLQHLKDMDADLMVTFLGRSQAQWSSLPGVRIADLPSLSELDFITDAPETLEEILNTCPIDVWFELTPTDVSQAEAVFRRIHTLLERGISVILANKSPVLHDYMALKTAARDSGASLGLSAVMGASLPSFAVGHYGTLGSDIKSMQGILNGTSNFVLALMEQGNTFAEAIDRAITTGIAEPNYDIDGIDSAIKMTILACVIQDRNVRLDLDQVKGLRTIDSAEFKSALAQGQRFKLVAEFTDDQVSVRPRRFGVDDLFYHVNGANKALYLETTTLSDMTVIGGKSGLPEVAASMYRDLCWMLPDNSR